MIKNKEEFLDELLNIRNEAGLSLEQISALSRINIEFLQSIEAGDFESLPSGYEKIFIKSYLKQIKALTTERDDWVNSYFSTGLKEDSVDEKSGKLPLVDFTKFKVLILWLPVISVLIFLFYIVYMNIGKIDQKPPVKEMTFEEQISQIDTLTLDTNQMTQAQKDSLDLQISILGPVFIVIVIDSTERKQYRFSRPGELKLKANTQFNIYANNGSNLDFSLDGRELGKVAGVNQRISYLIIEKDGIIARGIVTIKPDTIKTIKVGQ